VQSFFRFECVIRTDLFFPWWADCRHRCLSVRSYVKMAWDCGCKFLKVLCVFYCFLLTSCCSQNRKYHLSWNDTGLSDWIQKLFLYNNLCPRMFLRGVSAISFTRILKKEGEYEEWLHDNAVTERRGRVVNTSASYSGGPGFKSRSRDRPSWLRYFVIFLSPSKRMSG
jgi:hypothetical protein